MYRQIGNQNCRDPSEWKLCPKVIQQVYQKRSMPKVDLLISWLSYRLPQWIGLENDVFPLGTYDPQQIWCNHYLYPFRLFSFILQVLRMVSSNQTEKNIICPTIIAFSNSIWLEISIAHPLLLPGNTRLKKLKKRSSFSNCKQNIVTSVMDHI